MKKRKPRILVLDIETAPMEAYVWGLHRVYIGVDQIKKDGYIMSFAAKWLGEKEIFSMTARQGYKRMLRKIKALLNKADIVLHYNGRRFDIPFIFREFALHKTGYPSKFDHIDLLAANRRAFKWPSNKMEYVSSRVGKHRKIKSGGFPLWKRALAGDVKAWDTMQHYNINDIYATESIYHDIKEVLPITSGFKRVMEYVNGERFYK